MAKHWMVVSLTTAGAGLHTDLVTTDDAAPPSSAAVQQVIQAHGPVAGFWSLGPFESPEAARYSSTQLASMANLLKVMTEQTALRR
ncbi:hypothetical protein AB0A69_08030 [Streptomyces sp. NPDC045431]|uniref:hypothetical protein n=1 Tax=Streptomyces sp. NPDC045431 TaxID=3155613 RepID=UPI00340EC9B4